MKAPAICIDISKLKLSALTPSLRSTSRLMRCSSPSRQWLGCALLRSISPGCRWAAPMLRPLSSTLPVLTSTPQPNVKGASRSEGTRGPVPLQGRVSLVSVAFPHQKRRISNWHCGVSSSDLQRRGGRNARKCKFFCVRENQHSTKF